MNVVLEKLLSESHFSPKDKYDFMQIYSLLSEHKKVGVLDNFEKIAEEINVLREELHTQQEILFGQALGSIEEKIKKRQQNSIVQTSRDNMTSLKNMF